MKRLVAATVLAIGSLAQHLYAQTLDPLSFFPHHQGDIWEYVYPMNPNNYEQNIITADSLGADGNYHLQTTLFGRVIVDTVTFSVFWYNTTYLRYRLDADSGDTWIAQRGGGLTLQATVVDVYEAFVFGSTPVTVKEIDYTDSASGLLFDTDYLANNFGLVGQDVDAFPVRRIRGTRIDGVQHGTITSTAEDPPHFPAISARLHQNFPNPFNPSTVLRYELPQSTNVELKVYDLLGHEIRILVREHQSTGTYEVAFDSQGLASGMYICQLRTSVGTTSKKMIIAR